MSKSHKPVRQEYIAKVRYINNLPPPPLNPKFIKYDTTESKSQVEEHDQLLSSLFRRENFKPLIENVDEEYGMNLNLINNPGVLDNQDFSSIIKEKSEEINLHPSDRILLRDAGIGKINKKDPEVSFLRRTEYISERSLPRAGGDDDSNSSSTANGNKSETFDSESQLKAIENTFDVAQLSLKNFKDLKHPSKKHLKAVNAWQLLPDTSMLDSRFLTVKFSGSASIHRELQALKRQQADKYDEDLQKKILETSVFKPITSNDGEWMSLYQYNNPNDKNYDQLSSLYNRLNSQEPEKPNNLVNDDSNEEFRFGFNKNYDMNFQKFSKPNEEISIKLVSENDGSHKKRKLAYYYPINGKIDLKKYRASANTQINKFVKESTYDVVNYKLREPTTDEMRKMDNVRSEFDPMEYEGEEEQEQDDEQEGEQDEEIDENGEQKDESNQDDKQDSDQE